MHQIALEPCIDDAEYGNFDIKLQRNAPIDEKYIVKNLVKVVEQAHDAILFHHPSNNRNKASILPAK
jgi:hypothetical protein